MYGIRGVWGGVRYDGGVGMVCHMEYLPRSLWPPLWLVGWEVWRSHRGQEEKLVLFKLQSWSVLWDVVPDVEELIFAQVTV